MSWTQLFFLVQQKLEEVTDLNIGWYLSHYSLFMKKPGPRPKHVVKLQP